MEKRSINTDLNNKDNTIEISVCSNYPYRKSDSEGYCYNEILEISENSVDFTRLVDGRAPLLLEHDENRQIGVCEKFWIDGDKVKASVRFSKNDLAQEVYKDMIDGIRRNISIGYIINSFDRAGIDDNGVTNIVVKNFTIYQVSVVSTPADVTVGYLRNLQTNGDIIPMEEEIKEEITETVVAEEEQKELETEITEEVVEDKVEEVIAEEQTETVEEKIDQIKEQIIDQFEQIKSLGELTR